MNEATGNMHVMERIDDYRRGSLDPQAQATVASHLAECSECAAALREAEEIGTLLRENAVAIPADAYFAAMGNRVRQRAAEREHTEAGGQIIPLVDQTRKTGMRRFWVWQAAAAVAVVSLVSFYTLKHEGPSIKVAERRTVADRVSGAARAEEEGAASPRSDAKESKVAASTEPEAPADLAADSAMLAQAHDEAEAYPVTQDQVIAAATPVASVPPPAAPDPVGETELRLGVELKKKESVASNATESAPVPAASAPQAPARAEEKASDDSIKQEKAATFRDTALSKATQSSIEADRQVSMDAAGAASAPASAAGQARESIESQSGAPTVTGKLDAGRLRAMGTSPPALGEESGSRRAGETASRRANAPPTFSKAMPSEIIVGDDTPALPGGNIAGALARPAAAGSPYLDAESARLRGDYQSAIKLYQQVIDANASGPEAAKARHRIADIHYENLKDTVKALEAYRLCLAEPHRQHFDAEEIRAIQLRVDEISRPNNNSEN